MWMFWSCSLVVLRYVLCYVLCYMLSTLSGVVRHVAGVWWFDLAMISNVVVLMQ